MQENRVVWVIVMKDWKKFIVPAEKIPSINDMLNEKKSVFISDIMRSVTSYNVDYVEIRRINKEEATLIKIQQKEVEKLKKLTTQSHLSLTN